MKALLANAQIILFAGILSSCTHIAIGSVRTTFIDPANPTGLPKLDIRCSTYSSTDDAEVNSKLKAKYDQGWRLAASGTKGMDLFLCFERPAGMVDATPPRARTRTATPAPSVTVPDDASAAPSDDSPKPRPARHRPALDADSPGDDAAAPAADPAPAADDSGSSDAPPPKSKRRRPSPPPSDDN